MNVHTTSQVWDSYSFIETARQKWAVFNTSGGGGIMGSIQYRQDNEMWWVKNTTTHLKCTRTSIPIRVPSQYILIYSEFHYLSSQGKCRTKHIINELIISPLHCGKGSSLLPYIAFKMLHLGEFRLEFFTNGLTRRQMINVYVCNNE